VAKAKGGDRTSLTLSKKDEDLILMVSAANPRVVVVMEGGAAISTEAWRGQVPSMLMLWYPGMEGGNALAALLSGDANPSGKLPCVFPKSPDQLPFFDPHADEIEYDLYHGYRLMDRQDQEPAFAFGYGLSYTSFALSDLHLEEREIPPDGALKAGLRVRNTGTLPGAEVIQLYVGCEHSRYDRPKKELKGFQKVTLQPGEECLVSFVIPASKLAVWDGGWKVEPESYLLWMGNSSRPGDLQQASFRVT